MSLGPRESLTIEVVFTPIVEGHATAMLGLGDVLR